MEAIKYYVKGAFLGITETSAVLEQQEELIADLSARVEDLVSEGKSEEEALGIAIASMGDLSGLVREFALEEPAHPGADKPPAPQVNAYAARLRLHAVSLSGVVALSVLVASLLIVVMASNGGSWVAVWSFMLCMAGSAWIAFTLQQFHARPQATAMIEQSWKVLFHRLLHWVGACSVAFLLNIMEAAVAHGGEFWAWTIWLAVLAWPGAALIEQVMLRSGKFIHSQAESQVEAEANDVVGPSTSKALDGEREGIRAAAAHAQSM